MNTQDDQDLTSLLEEINSKSNNKNISYCNKEKTNNHNHSINKSSTANGTFNNTNHNISTQNNIINTNFHALNNSLSENAKKNIFKESLVIELREELKHNKTFNKMYSNYLNDVIKLKEEVKLNKDKVEDNMEKLKREFADKFDVIDSYEKKIQSLKEARIEIEKTNEDIVRMKQKISDNLNKEITNLDSKLNDQRSKIEKLENDIANLEKRKLHINEEFAKIREEEDKQYIKLEKEYKILQEKYRYFQNEYNKFEKIPDDLVKIDVKLQDYSYSKRMLAEENLKIKLVEKNLEKYNLLNDIITLNAKLKNLDTNRKKKKKLIEVTSRSSIKSNSYFKSNVKGRIKKEGFSKSSYNKKK